MRTRIAVAVVLSGCETFFPLQDPDPLVNCQEDYLELDLGGIKGRYRLETVTATNFFAAEQQCVTEGAHLAVLGSQASSTMEVEVVAAQIDPMTGSDYFIGLSNKNATTADSYRWITAEPIPVPPPGDAPWEEFQPATPDVNHCGQLDHVTGLLRSEKCGIDDFYICECDGLPADPERF